MPNFTYSILLFTALLLSTVTVNAQDIPWLEVGSEWIYQHGVWSGPEHFQVTYGITEQTTFAGKECAKMENTSTLGLGCLGLYPPFYFYVSNDSLYFANDELDDFRLAIYFGAEQGDSWEFIAGEGEFTTSFSVEVNSVTTVEIGGHSLRRLSLTYEVDMEGGDLFNHFIYPETMEITEVIGAPYMFFVPLGHHSACDYETDVTFQCFESPSLSYLNPEYPSCNYVVGTDDNSLTHTLSVFPSPTSQVLTVEIPPNHTGKTGTLTIFDLAGKSVYQTDDILESRMQIPVARLNKGIYFIHIRSDELNGISRFVKF